MTTIVSVRRNGHVVIAGDGQATLGNTVMKGNVKKVRRLYNDKVIAGFAGGTADAFTLFELFERKLEMHQGHLDVYKRQALTRRRFSAHRKILLK